MLSNFEKPVSQIFPMRPKVGYILRFPRCVENSPGWETYFFRNVQEYNFFGCCRIKLLIYEKLLSAFVICYTSIFLRGT